MLIRHTKQREQFQGESFVHRACLLPFAYRFNLSPDWFFVKCSDWMVSRFAQKDM